MPQDAAGDRLAPHHGPDHSAQQAARARHGRQLYLDCDGVLADFDAGAARILGMPPKAFQDRHGAGRFWARLATAPDFYGSLPLMPGALELFDAVRQLDPVILTGLPRGRWAAAQKVRWAQQHFPGTRIITVMAVDKRDHCVPGDVLVDDTLKHRQRWEDAGGIFVHHVAVATTLAELRTLFPS
jgi:hypothetical protein